MRVADVDAALVFPSFEHGARAGGLVAVPGGIGAHKWADRRLLEQAERDAGGAAPLILTPTARCSRPRAAACSWCATVCS